LAYHVHKSGCKTSIIDVVKIQLHNSRKENCKGKFCIAKGIRSEEMEFIAKLTLEFPGLVHDEVADEIF